MQLVQATSRDHDGRYGGPVGVGVLKNVTDRGEVKQIPAPLFTFLLYSSLHLHKLARASVKIIIAV